MMLLIAGKEEKMKSNYLAAPFHLNNPYDEVIDEFNIIFDDTKNDFKKLVNFVKEYPDKRINIEFINKVDLSLVDILRSMHDQIYLRINTTNSFYIEEFDEQVKWFFDSSVCAANNYSMLEYLLDLGVSDIYIADDLCYNLIDVKEYCGGTHIRLILNRIPSLLDKHCFKSPIFRPQDIDLLKKYIDTFEFDCGQPYDWALFDVLYRSWFEKKYWLGDLREINQDLDFEFPNASVPVEMNEYKIQCGLKCVAQTHYNYCRKCQDFMTIGYELKNKEIRFKP